MACVCITVATAFEIGETEIRGKRRLGFEGEEQGGESGIRLGWTRRSGCSGFNTAMRVSDGEMLVSLHRWNESSSRI